MWHLITTFCRLVDFDGDRLLFHSAISWSKCCDCANAACSGPRFCGHTTATMINGHDLQLSIGTRANDNSYERLVYLRSHVLVVIRLFGYFFHAGRNGKPAQLLVDRRPRNRRGQVRVLPLPRVRVQRVFLDQHPPHGLFGRQRTMLCKYGGDSTGFNDKYDARAHACLQPIFR